MVDVCAGAAGVSCGLWTDWTTADGGSAGSVIDDVGSISSDVERRAPG